MTQAQGKKNLNETNKIDFLVRVTCFVFSMSQNDNAGLGLHQSVSRSMIVVRVAN